MRNYQRRLTEAFNQYQGHEDGQLLEVVRAPLFNLDGDQFQEYDGLHGGGVIVREKQCTPGKQDCAIGSWQDRVPRKERGMISSWAQAGQDSRNRMRDDTWITA